MMIKDGHEATNTTSGDVHSEATSDDEYMDSENCSDQLVNETSSDNEPINNDPAMIRQRMHH